MKWLRVLELEVHNVDICSPDSSSLKAFQILGYILIIIKILVPLIIIVLGSIEFFKASLSGDDKANNAALKALFNKIILGISIFFVPTILDVMLSMVKETKEVGNNYKECTKCLLNPTSSDCKAKDLLSN